MRFLLVGVVVGLEALCIMARPPLRMVVAAGVVDTQKQLNN